MTDQDYSRLMHHFQQVQEAPCLLCGKRPVTAVGIYIPPRVVEQQVLHLPDNKMALCVHGLCERCSVLPSAPALVEQTFIQLHAAQN